MKRFACLVALVALSSPACAREYSFRFRGQDIHVEAARHCRSLSCVSVSVGGRRDRRDRDDDEVATARAPVAAPTPAQAQPVQTLPAPTRVQTVPGPVAVQPAPVTVPIQVPVQAPAQLRPASPPPAPMPAPTLASAPSAPPSAAAPAKMEQLASITKPQPKSQPPARIEEAEGDPDTPVGDWQTDGKANLVRIESCGTALCGYVLDAATHTKGETILINMKPKTDTQWTGNVYSRSSGNSYYGRVTLKDAKTLRVEACALGSFFCSGNNWTRSEQKPASADDLISSQENAPRVHS